MDCTIALAQIDSSVGNLKNNIEHHLAYIKKAIALKADVVVFPELSLTGYTLRDVTWDVALRIGTHPMFKEIEQLSKKITIITGGVEEAENFGIYNSAFVFEDGVMHSAHRKVYPPTYGMFEEQRYFSKGESVRCFQSKHGKLGILICEDLWHLPLPYLLAQDGADVIISLTASPTRLSGTEKELSADVVNSEHHKAYSRLLSSYLVFCNRVGIEDGVTFWGGSQIVSPSGAIITKAKFFDEDIITAHIQEEEIRRARKFSRHFIDDSPEFTVQQLQLLLQRKHR